MRWHAISLFSAEKNGEIVDMQKKHEKHEKRFEQINNRLDGLYRVILDRTYGKNIPEELK